MTKAGRNILKGISARCSISISNYLCSWVATMCLLGTIILVFITTVKCFEQSPYPLK